MRVVAPVVSLAAALISGFLGACSSATTGSFTAFADPGKYQYHNCKQLARPHRRAMKRMQELKLLMDKAEQSTGGAFVNVIAYKADYVQATEDLSLIEAAEHAKNCDQSWSQKPQDPEKDDKED